MGRERLDGLIAPSSPPPAVCRSDGRTPGQD